MSIMTWKMCGPMRLRDWKSSAVLLAAALLLSWSPSARAFDMNAGVSKESGPFDLFKFGFNAYKKGQKEEAVEAYRYAAEKGHTGSRWALANMYAAGDGVVENDFEAFKIYAEIANQGVEPGSADTGFFVNALLSLARYYRQGIPETPVKADLARRGRSIPGGIHLRCAGSAVSAGAHDPGGRGRQCERPAGEEVAEHGAQEWPCRCHVDLRQCAFRGRSDRARSCIPDGSAGALQR